MAKCRSYVNATTMKTDAVMNTWPKAFATIVMSGRYTENKKKAPKKVGGQ